MFLVLVAVPLFAADLGRAEGSLTIGTTEVPLAYAYVMGRAHNDLNNRNDATKIILTDKPLPAGTKLADLDANFPDGILGVVVSVNKDSQPLHLVVQHPTGMYDAGWMEPNKDVQVRARKSSGQMNGHLSIRKMETASVTFAFDADFNAQVQ
ncbi:MAG TPA: hypothetical protein VH087_17680 [Thermoanaerobaculia bacterium]|nr:hypothetical protein [Thermoanaerobaculia bacterium]